MGNTAKLLLRLTDLAVLIATEGAAAIKQYRELRGKIGTFVEQNREPTDAEFHELLRETESLSSRLDAADKRLNP